ncbi:MAG: hypothetical protein PHE59_01940 [Patescibacteria group bacterium]|nr:hypothetical protein [Patescibacteria group bacterium]MDD5164106.1 hypothetical protein [Patescibacteria group bacterium]MDD5534236.1 hypothetical protein [Patescibacteria group bacterium]
MKIVLNASCCEFCLSHEAIKKFAKLKGFKINLREGNYIKDGKRFYFSSIGRTDPALIQVIEELGEKANGINASLVIMKIPDGTKYTIRGKNSDGDDCATGEGNQYIVEECRIWQSEYPYRGWVITRTGLSTTMKELNSIYAEKNGERITAKNLELLRKMIDKKD